MLGIETLETWLWNAACSTRGAVDAPKFNDDSQNIKEIGEFLSSLKIAQINLLPYHYMGIDKYRRLGRTYHLVATQPPSEEKLFEVSAILSKFNLKVKLRG